MTGISENIFSICSKRLNWFSKWKPQVSDASNINNIASAKCSRATIAFNSISFISKTGLSSKPGVSIIWMLFQCLSVCPICIPLVVNG